MNDIKEFFWIIIGFAIVGLTGNLIFLIRDIALKPLVHLLGG